MIRIVDSFFKKPLVIRGSVLRGPFHDHLSPVDGVTYPGINEYLARTVQDELHGRIEEIVGCKILPRATFARVTHCMLQAAPHEVHCDKEMGAYGCLVYLSWPEEGAIAGTGFYRHIGSDSVMWQEGMGGHEINAAANNPGAWEMREMAGWAFNRGVIYDARLWHSALPVGGWGDGNATGRLVLTCFFDLGD
jgi:hypothetical protein